MDGFAYGSLKAFNSILNRAVILLLLLLFSISFYALWDNRQIYQSVEKVMSELYRWRPTAAADDSGWDFAALKEINPDVCGWISVEGAGIDYPIVRGRNNRSYLNRDVFGQFSLAGSIFLDSQNSADFTDKYSLIYGHHMDRHLMFGDLDLFKEEEFFNESRSITLTTERGVQELRPLAVMEVSAGEAEVFNISGWDGNMNSLLDFIKRHGIQVDNYTMEIVSSDPTVVKVVVLVTCSSGHTNTRTILITVAPAEEDVGGGGENADDNTGGNAGSNTADNTGEDAGDHTGNNAGIGGEDMEGEDEGNENAPAKTGDPLYDSKTFWCTVMVTAALLYISLHIYEKKRYRPKRLQKRGVA